MSRETRGQALTLDGPPQQALAWERWGASPGWLGRRPASTCHPPHMAGEHLLAVEGLHLCAGAVIGSKAWRRRAFYDKVLGKGCAWASDIVS